MELGRLGRIEEPSKSIQNDAAKLGNIAARQDQTLKDPNAQRQAAQTVQRQLERNAKDPEHIPLSLAEKTIIIRKEQDPEIVALRQRLMNG